MNILVNYTIKEISISIFATLIELVFGKDDNYEFDKIKEFMIDIIENGDIIVLLSNLSPILDNISIYDIIDYVLDNLDNFCYELVNYLNNKNNQTIFFLATYITPYLVDLLTNELEKSNDTLLDNNDNIGVGDDKNFNNINSFNNMNNDTLMTYTVESFKEYYDFKTYKFESISYTDLRFKFIIHKHEAKRAGLHYDLRIEIAKDKVISVAFRKYPLEKKRVMGIVQPIHESYWMTFQGEIKEGYGAGKLTIVNKGIADFFITENKTLILILYDIYDDKYYKYAIIPGKNLLFVKSEKEFDDVKKLSKTDILEYFYKKHKNKNKT